jgi:hypothetical protein
VTPSCLLTAVRVQIPFEIFADVAKSTPQGPATLAPLAALTLEVDGQSSFRFLLQPVPDNSHVVTSCDVAGDTKATSVCDRIALHADGSVVSADAPASRGETLVAFAFGLGQTAPPATTGQISATPAAVTSLLGAPRVAATVGVNNINAVSSSPRSFSQGDSSDVSAKIAFAGLAPGQVGMYQLNIVVPESLKVLIACGGEVHANATLRIATSEGTEQLAICIRP